ncbi:MAG: undecaprenyl-diphosphate phosphatase [Candidatus Micrarchaeia archaeon]|jgi:undecaprenyl-diphosphatase
MDILQALLLGLVQGFTEWLPISSSGHLVIAHTLLNIPSNAAFDIVLMIGTIAALLIYFREKIIWLLKGIISREKGAVHYVLLLVLAGIPTGIIGFAGKKFFEGLFAMPFLVSIFIFITGLFLFLASRAKNASKPITTTSAFAVGIAQGIAVAPGISRSGSTIGTALLLGVEPKAAAEFSFIVGIPAMIVASLLEFQGMGGVGSSALAIGLLASFAAGYASIGFFMEILKRGKLAWFAYYCLAAGIAFALLTYGR